jgi:hypothetical protein
MSGAPGVSAPSVADIQLGPGLGARGSVTATGGYQTAAPPSITPQERAAAVLTGRTPPAQPPVEPPIPGSIVSPPPISPPFLDPAMDMVSPSLPPPPPPPPDPPGAAVSARARELKYGSRAERERAARIRARTQVRPLMG